MLRAFGFAFAFCALCACGDPAPTDDGGTSSADAGGETYDAVVLSAIAEPIAPTEPAAPMIPASPAPVAARRCPDGWIIETSTRSIGETFCRPFVTPLDCAPNTAQRPGQSACTDVGYMCPAGEFFNFIPEAPISYVHAGESIAQAIAAAPPKAIISLARGTFDENVFLPEGIKLFGACPALTRVSTVTAAGQVENLSFGTLVVAGPNVRATAIVADAMFVRFSGGVNVFDALIDHLEVHEAGNAAFEYAAINSAVLDSTITTGIRDSRIGDLETNGAASIFHSVLRSINLSGGNRPLNTETIAVLGGNGLSISGGGAALLRKALFEDNVDTAINVAGIGSQVTAEDLVVRNTKVSPTDRRRGRALVVVDGAKAIVRRAALTGNLDFGAVANAAGTTMELEDVVVRDTRPNSVDHLRGIALSAQNGASLLVSRARLDHNSAGVAGATGATIVLNDVTIDTTVGLPGGELGYGIALTGNVAELYHVSINDARFHGALLAGQDTVVIGEDLAIARVAPQALDALYGRGLGVEGGAKVTLARVSIEDTHETALSAIDPGTVLSISDLQIAHTEARAADGKVGYGVLVQGGASATIDRAVIEAATRVAVVANVGSALSLSDTVIRDTASDPNGDFGMGLVAASTTVTLARVALEGNRHTALRIEGPSSVLRASDLKITGTLPRESDSTIGAGLLVFDGARAVVERVDSEHNNVYAIAVNGGAILDATDVIASHTGEETNGLFGTGLYVQDHAIARITRGRFNDNAQVSVLAQVLSHVELEDVEVSDTRKGCVPERADCLDQAGGIGIGSYASSSITAHLFLLQRSAVAGAAIANGGVVDFSFGEIRDQPIGINIETEGYILERAGPGVRYINNVLSSDGAMLPVPNGLGDIPSPLD